ncbi:MAG: hypothetical protein M1838_005737 [Thelocarpon superellum]|nr:MAG: hypothetical protein M1838_005737 [Thelocarpon superellum]
MPRRHRPPRAGALADLQPVKILSQIAALQAAYYASVMVLMLFTTLVAGQPFGLDLVLDWHSLRGDTAVGWTLGFVWLLDAFFGALFILVLIARSKLVPDFALTLHFIHLVLTALYSRGVPANWLWWALQAASATVMVSLGTWSCQWRELRPMSFGAGAAGDGSSGGGGPRAYLVAQDAAGEDEEEGVSERERGRGRGRGRSGGGGGEYQMVGLNASKKEDKA